MRIETFPTKRSLFRKESVEFQITMETEKATLHKINIIMWAWQIKHISELYRKTLQAT